MNLPLSHRRARGVALVITLIMLSVVTITAVAFLAMSRRERASVAAAADQADAKYMADVALARAQANLSGRMMGLVQGALQPGLQAGPGQFPRFISDSGRIARSEFGFLVSTNWQTPIANPQNPAAEIASVVARLQADATGGINSFANRANRTNILYPPNFTGNESSPQYRALLRSLYYDPRAPVFTTSTGLGNTLNNSGPLENQFYLDLNRNGQYDTNGWVAPRNRNGTLVTGAPLQAQFGDPEWIGILEHPDEPHSGSNRFVGRMAFFVQPVGRTLDLNFIHNSAKGIGYDRTASRYAQSTSDKDIQDGFLRNQGLGSWELNLAGLLVDLNTNNWPGPTFNPANGRLQYNYRLSNVTDNRGQAFWDAAIIYRKNREYVFQSSLARAIGGLNATPLTLNRLDNRKFDSDLYANGPVLLSFNDILNPRARLTSNFPTLDQVSGTLDWPGSDSAGIFADVFQLVNPGFLSNSVLSTTLLGRLPTDLPTTLKSSYDSGTFYRLVDSIGSDTPDARFESGVDFRGVYYRRAKLNLNYAHDLAATNMQTQVDVAHEFKDASGTRHPFGSWAPIEWFTNTVQRLLAQQIETNALYLTPAVNGNSTTPFRPAINPLVLRGYGYFATNSNARVDYSARPHQLFQLAANIYESTHYSSVDYADVLTLSTNRRAETPITYRPTFYFDPVTTNGLRRSGNIRLAGFQEVTAPEAFLSQRWVDPANPLDADIATFTQDRPATNLNVYGVPWVVGTKKGYPTFEEGFWQTGIDITRRVRAVKLAPAVLAATDLPSPTKSRRLELQYVLNVTNQVGADAIKSYSTPFTRKTRILATNIIEYRFGYRLPTPVPQGVLRTFADYIPLNTFTDRLTSNRTLDSWKEVPEVLLRGVWATNFLMVPVNGRPAIYPGSATNRVPWALANDPSAQYFDIAVEVRNRLVYALIDESTVPHRLLDMVNLESRMEQTDLLGFLRRPGAITPGLDPGLTGRATGKVVSPTDLWLPKNSAIPSPYTEGIDDQLLVSMGRATARDWARNARGSNFRNDSIIENQVDGLLFFLYGTIPPESQLSDPAVRKSFEGNEVQLGYNPTHYIFLTDRRMANDPLVHYTMEDLGPGLTISSDPQQYVEVVVAPGAGGRIPLADELSGRLAGSVKNQFRTNQIGSAKIISMRAPWGAEPRLGFGAAPSAADPSSFRYDIAYKDPLIQSPDDWAFPTGKMASLGQLGRIHRGTPWQTIYMKSAMPAGPSTRIAKLAVQRGIVLPVQPTLAGRYLKTLSDGTAAKQWMTWAGNPYTRPENDWQIFDLFTTALNENAAKGLLSVNNTNRAAWSAVLSGVPVLSDSRVPLSAITGHTNQSLTDTPVIEPGSRELGALVESINESRQSPNRLGLRYLHVGDVFSAPSLTAGANEFVPVESPNYAARGQSPFLAAFNPVYGSQNRPNSDAPQVARVPDEVLERIPQQIVGLLRQDEPKFVIYAFGQSLKPAPGSILTAPGTFFNLCTNYVVTGEFSTRTVVRFDGSPTEPINSDNLANRFRPVIEDHRVLPPPQ